VVFLTDFTSRLFQCTFFLALLIIPGLARAAGAPIPFEAKYQVLIDGKPRMESLISLRNENGTWFMTSDGKGTKGLAKILGAKTSERSKGTVENGIYTPAEYSQNSKVMGNGKKWNATFDWADGQITTHHKEGESRIEIQSGTIDPLSLTLAVNQQLVAGRKEFSLNVIDQEEIDQHDFSAGVMESLSTSIGCFESIPVTRVRTNSTRHSSGWYAKSLNFIPVKMKHGKEGGRQFEMNIIQLTLNGETISGKSDCSK
jgi:hypothetical protein